MVSIVIPCYNAEKTIRRCLESVFAGTRQDFEVILCEDGSADRTLEVCRSITDPRVRVIAAEKNCGVSHARNAGLDAARGEYISFIDADDTVSEDYLEVLCRTAEESGADWTAGGFAIVDEDEPDRTLFDLPMLFDHDTFIGEEDISAFLPAKIFYNEERYALGSVCGALYRRDLIEKQGVRFREKLKYGEDTFFNLCYAVSCRSFAFAAKRIYRYHQHVGMSTDVLFKRYTIEQFTRMLEATEALRKETGGDLPPEESRYVVSQSFGFLNQNAFLQPQEKRDAYLREFDRCRTESEAVSALWTQMKAEDFPSRLMRLRFRLIQQRRYKTLGTLQAGIRTLRRLPGLRRAES